MDNINDIVCNAYIGISVCTAMYALPEVNYPINRFISELFSNVANYYRKNRAAIIKIDKDALKKLEKTNP
jgi:hypothetical protein